MSRTRLRSAASQAIPAALASSATTTAAMPTPTCPIAKAATQMAIATTPVPPKRARADSSRHLSPRRVRTGGPVVIDRVA
ncbi:hypothetical protein I553_6600 [Mycobacterium xenopi 4042]|uniref:Secreted protein n=1 Tax=Mycobacterium xenopi 4042 TaxID=1299334 RepID=X8BI53_MYCXE|nr:hypothetical protein I553_6600 [Mycobacterium xenopi 4042]